MLNSTYNPEFSVRKSQLLTPYGTGSLIDINNQTIMLVDSEYWNIDNKLNIIHDVRLEKKLGATGFVRPPDVNQKEEIYGKRFPTWFYSPKDRSLKPFSKWYKEFEKSRHNDVRKFHNEPYDARRNNNKINLVPVRLVSACSNGHAQEFPWIEWVHGSNSEAYLHHELKLKSSGTSSSISDLKVECVTCGDKSKKLANIFDVKSFNNTLDKIGVACKGNYHWKKDDHSRKDCKAPLNVLLKNSNSFYFPNIVSSVNIPFKENKIYEEIIESEFFPGLYSEIQRERDTIQNYNDFKDNVFIKRRFEDLFNKMEKYTQDEIMKSVYQNQIESVNEYDDLSEMEFRREEFEVLSGIEDFDTENNRFNLKKICEKEFENEKYGELIDSISLVNKLEVVRVLESYSRIRPSDSDIYDEEMPERPESKKVSLERTDKKYIGVDLLGEGIFISFKPKSIQEWLTKIDEKQFSDKIYKKINSSYNNEAADYICPEYYMLHTLSHILIKELSETSGYSSSALAERLYFSDKEGKEMYGILIYTSSSDSEGTLGGLVKQGYPKNLMKTLDLAIEKAKWCSFDPVCISTDSQGRDSLNSAACHACSLISETSCEHANLYLDRSMLIGDLDNPKYGFFYNH